MLAQFAINQLKDRAPKVISPRTHAIIDYAMAGSFLLMGFMFWKSNKRASLASFAVAAAELGTSAMTDYPGGVSDVIDWETHGKIDAGMAGLVATMPNMLAFHDEDEAKYFRIQSIGMAAVTALTDFESQTSSRRNRRLVTNAA
jgi:hypothetical protein